MVDVEESRRQRLKKRLERRVRLVERRDRMLRKNRSSERAVLEVASDLNQRFQGFS